MLTMHKQHTSTLSKIAVAVALLLAIPTAASAQVEWLTWEQAMERQATAPRKIIVDVYTDWCGWCKEMDRRTFSDPGIAAQISSSFYAVKLNAEQAGDLRFRGKTFTLESAGRRPTHALARELLNGKMSYPSVVFLSEQTEVIQAVPGFHAAEEFQKIVQYFGDGVYRKQAWRDFVIER